MSGMRGCRTKVPTHVKMKVFKRFGHFVNPHLNVHGLPLRLKQDKPVQMSSYTYCLRENSNRHKHYLASF